MSSGRCELRMRMWQRRLRRQQDNTSSKRKRTKDKGSGKGEKHFGRGPKYLTLQMKWQNVESNAQTAQNVMPEQGRGQYSTPGWGQGRVKGEQQGSIKTEPKDATRTDSNKIETNATHGTAQQSGKQPKGLRGRQRTGGREKGKEG